MNDFNLNTNKKIGTGFTTPDNYFTDFYNNLLSQEDFKEVKLLSFYEKNKNWLYSAAAIFVVAFSIPILNLINLNENTNYNKEVENYISVHSTITDDDIVNLLDTKDIENLKKESVLDDDILENTILEDSDIENYITN